MSKDDYKNGPSSTVLSDFLDGKIQRQREVATPEDKSTSSGKISNDSIRKIFQQQAYFPLYDPVKLDDGEELTSVILCEFIRDVMGVDYDNVIELIDCEIDHDEDADNYTVFLAPREALTRHQHVRGEIVVQEFLSSLTKFSEPPYSHVDVEFNYIHVSTKMDLLKMLTRFLNKKGISVFDIGKAPDYSDDAYAVDSDHVETLEKCIPEAVSQLKRNPPHMEKIMMASFITSYFDCRNFIAHSQSVINIFERAKGKNYEMIVLSNAHAVLSERILLENRNNPDVRERFSAPRYFIN